MTNPQQQPPKMPLMENFGQQFMEAAQYLGDSIIDRLDKLGNAIQGKCMEWMEKLKDVKANIGSASIENGSPALRPSRTPAVPEKAQSPAIEQSVPSQALAKAKEAASTGMQVESASVSMADCGCLCAPSTPACGIHASRSYGIG